MREKTTETAENTKTIYATMFTLAASVMGQQYYESQRAPDPRPDPFTGTQGAELREDIDRLEHMTLLFVERGPKDIRTGLQKNEILLKEAIVMLKEFTIMEKTVRAQQDEIEDLVREIRDDHYTKHHNQG